MPTMTMTRTQASSKNHYPTTPIQIFPPPAPNVVAPRPANPRTGSSLRLQMQNAPSAAPVLPGWSPKGHIQPHRSHLPRRRSLRRIAVQRAEEATVSEQTIPAPVPSPKPVEPAPVQADSNPSTITMAEPESIDPKMGQKGPVQPHRDHLPRRRTTKPVVFQDSEVEDAKKKGVRAAKVPLLKMPQPKAARKMRAGASSSGARRATPSLPHQEADGSQLQVLAPGVSIAFGDEDLILDRLPGATPAHLYTHVVHIIHGDDQAIQRTEEGGMRILQLSSPHSTCVTRTARAGLGLVDKQLRAAREFLSEALPDLNIFRSTTSSTARLIVLGPRTSTTDILSVVSAYAASVTGKSVEEILRHIDSNDEFLSVWKGEVSEDEVVRVEAIARA